MKGWKKFAAISCAAVLTVGGISTFAACGGGGDDGDFDEEGNYKPSATGTTIQFWGYGDAAETEVFGTIVDNFNTSIGKDNNVKVNYTSFASTEYTTNVGMALSDINPPDVVYVEDKYVKSWADADYLDQIDKKNSDGSYVYPGVEEFLGGQVWEQGVQRYRYDVSTATVTDNATLWALPKDIGPTVIYYNATKLKTLGIEIISIPAGANLEAAGYPEKGYFQKGDKWYFNNRVPMSWEETIALAQRLQTAGLCDYGFFTEWWFSYGWSVGGDCVEYVTDDKGGYYKFTLNDETYNYIVKDTVAELTVNGHLYKKGEIISYTDKQASGDWKSSCNQLPSMKDAFLEFCALTTPDGTEVGTRTDGSKKYGNKVSMGAESLGSQQAEDLFASGNIGMFVDGRWEVTFLREAMTDEWDVAPLPVYKEYDTDGNITKHGVQAGHSGSVGLAISKDSTKKSAAWLFLRYVAGAEGQTAQSEKGFCIPNQKTLANSETFLQTNQAPKNSIIFVEAAAYETPGDWWYLKDSSWIDEWANYLNYFVREGKANATVDKLFADYSVSTQNKLYAYTGYRK